MSVATPPLVEADPLERARFSFAMLSSVGRVRKGNEDFCLASPTHGVFVVCDGMGGAAAGEVASELAATTFIRHIEGAPVGAEPELPVRAAVAEANASVFLHSREQPSRRGMGTTLVALLLAPEVADNAMWLAHVGDSRCYRLRAGELLQLTRDHSLVDEQVLRGELTAEQAERSPMRHIITRAVGSLPEVEADLQRLSAAPGDLYLLASDGLTRELSDRRVAECLHSGGDLEALCQRLVEAANAAGGRDNITVLLLRFE